MADDPAPPKRNRIQRRASQLLQELDRQVERRNSQETPTPTTAHRPRVRRRHSQAPPDKASLEGPPVVWAGGGTRQAPLPMHLKLLVAPIAGMLAGTLEITSLWPMEWAKVQIQLNKGVPGWSLMGDVRRVGLGLYKGLPAMLVGVPLQGAVRFTTLDAVKALVTEPGTQAGPLPTLSASQSLSPTPCTP